MLNAEFARSFTIQHSSFSIVYVRTTKNPANLFGGAAGAWKPMRRARRSTRADLPNGRMAVMAMRVVNSRTHQRSSGYFRRGFGRKQAMLNDEC